MGEEVLLQMTDISKSFPGVKALDHVSLTVRRGTVHALMGENGAGKSTLMKCLFGIYSKDPWLGRNPLKVGSMVDEHKMYQDTMKVFKEL